MCDETASFKSGDRVRIKNGLFKGQVGEVISILHVKTKSVLSELVWVKLVNGKVEGFNSKNLEKFGKLSKHHGATG